MDTRLITSLRAQIPAFPEIHPEQLETHYNSAADSLVVYFTPDHLPTYWSELDDYLLIGRKVDSDEVTGIMIEYFSEWLLLATDQAQRAKSLAAA